MRVLTDAATLDEYSSDAGLLKLRPKSACFASDEGEVVSLVDQAIADGVKVTARGGGTSIPSQSVGSGMILLQESRGPSFNGGEVSCGPGLVKADLNGFLTYYSRWMPVDPSSYASCTIGGMVANNSSGVRTPKYGSTIDYAVRLRAVTPGRGALPVEAVPIEEALSSDATTRRVASLIIENAKDIAEERPLVTKNSSGYRLERVVHDGVVDLPKLFVGSEGTLGVVTKAELRTVPQPSWRVLFITESSLDDLGPVVKTFSELSPTALELVDKSVFKRLGRADRIARYSRSEQDYMVFCEFDGQSGEPDNKLSEVASSRAQNYDPLVLTSPSEVAEAWGVRNETLRIAQEMREGGRILVPGVEDLAVPPDRLVDVVRLLVDQFERRGLEYISYGHAGDANLHARPMLDPSVPWERRVLDEIMDECFEAVWKMKGSITGEHGDGMLRAKYVERQYPKTHWIMKEIRQAYDPKGVLNPGVKIV